MKVYDIEDISFSYLEEPVIRGVAFDITDGELFGIIGPNGAGKSTLLRILGRVLEARSGRVFLMEKSIESYDPRELARLVAFVPQETHFGLDFTALEVVKMGRYPHLPMLALGDERDTTSVDQAVSSADIAALTGRMVNSLSSGERQRVIIARALAQRPKVLLLDEPTSHLDLKHQFEIMELLKRLNQAGLTVVLVSHDLNLASLYCSRILLMQGGRVEAIDRPEKIVSREWLAKVYGIDPEIVLHPKQGKPQILLPG